MARKRASEPGDAAEVAPSARFKLRRVLLLVGWLLLILYVVAASLTLRQEMANRALLSARSLFDALALDLSSPLSWTPPGVALLLLVVCVYVTSVAAGTGKRTPLRKAPATTPLSELQAPIPRVFISHSSADNKFGLALEKELTSALGGAPGLVWYDASGSPQNDYASGLLGGDPWWEKIRYELGERDVFVVILSPDAMASRWVRDEVNIAWVTDKVIVPVLHRECQIHDDLKLIQHVSFLTSPPDGPALTELLSAIRLGKTRRRDPEARVLRPMGIPKIPELFGRDNRVAEIEHTLHASHTATTCVVTGMPGVGKSALAAWITERATSDSQAFPGGSAWIPCNDLTSDDHLQEVYARLARILARDDIAEEKDPQIRQRRLVDILRNRSRTLLTFDNIEPGFPVQTLVEHLAIRDYTALLLTSRETLEVNLDHLIHLDPLATADGVRLFVDSRARKGFQTPEGVNEIPHVVILVNKLGRLPLAIYLTAAYCASQKFLADRMVEVLNAEHLNAVAFADPKVGLTACFDRSLQALPLHCQNLFAGLSLFAGASIPRSAGRQLSVELSKAQPYLPRMEGGHRPASVASLALHTREKTVAGDGAITTLVNSALVEAPDGGRLRIHPLLYEYADKLFQTLDSRIQDTLGSAMANYWATFVEQSETEFGDLAFAAEVEGITQAVRWARQHGDSGIIERIQSSQATVGARRTFRFLSIFSWAERVGPATGSFIELLSLVQAVQSEAADIIARSRPHKMISQFLEARAAERRIYAHLEVTYAWMLDKFTEGFSNLLSHSDRADTYFNRADNQFKWAQSEAAERHMTDALAHLRLARVYAITALGLGYQNALGLIDKIASDFARIEKQV